MSVFFNPSGALNIAYDPSDLPEQAEGPSISSGAMTRCKNLRIDEKGKAITRDGSEKIHVTAMDEDIWRIEVHGPNRYTFSGTVIYKNEVSVATGLTAAPWSAIQYNAFNDVAPNVFALNGTDRKRIQSGFVFEWGIDAPTVKPTVSVGGGSGLSGTYKFKYTYVRKSGDVVVCESNPSPASEPLVISGTSGSVDITAPTDNQVTHIRLYRTFSGGDIYYLDQDIVANVSYGYGYCFDWESAEADLTATTLTYDYGYAFAWETASFTGVGYLYGVNDLIHETRNMYAWEFRYATGEVLVVSASPDPLVETIDIVSGYCITSDCTITTSGSTGTIAYSWNKVAGDPIIVTNPTGQITSFIASGMTTGAVQSATFRCTVTDTYYSIDEDVTVTITGGTVVTIEIIV